MVEICQIPTFTVIVYCDCLCFMNYRKVICSCVFQIIRRIPNKAIISNYRTRTMSAIPNQPAESISLGRLKSLGVLAPEFVPFLLPTRYLDLNHDQLTTGFADLRDGDKVILYGTLVECSVHRNSVPSRTVAKLVDEYGHEITATFFGDPRIYAADLDGKLHCKVCFAGQIGYYAVYSTP